MGSSGCACSPSTPIASRARSRRTRSSRPAIATPATPSSRGRSFSQEAPDFEVGKIVNGGCQTTLTPDVIAGYDAPFPDDTYKEGARQFPLLVPSEPRRSRRGAEPRCVGSLRTWTKPFLCAFSDHDPITAGADRVLREEIPGCKGQPHTTIEGRRALPPGGLRAGARARRQRVRQSHIEPEPRRTCVDLPER